MLRPAILYKDEIEKKFAERMYSDGFFYYCGYPFNFTLPNIEPADNVYQFAVIDNNDELVGYLAYRVDPYLNSAYNFGLYSFKPGNQTLPKDLFEEMNSLVSKYHRVEWRVIGGNKVEKSYDQFCKQHNGNKITLHDATKDLSGNYVNEYIYEIVNE